MVHEQRMLPEWLKTQACSTRCACLVQTADGVYLCSVQASLSNAACCMRIIHNNSHPETVALRKAWAQIMCVRIVSMSCDMFCCAELAAE